MKHNPFDQGEIRSGELTTASSNNAEVASAQVPAQEIPAEKTTSETTEDTQLPAEYFLEQHYNFRRNVLSGMVEYKKADEPDEKFSRLTSEALNTIYIMGMREMPDVSELKADIKTYVESSIPPVYDVKPQSLTIKKMDKRWGYCTSDGHISLNPRLICAPRCCIEYVITHEMCHLIYRNHTKDFYALLTKEMPHWEKWKNKLERIMM